MDRGLGPFDLTAPIIAYADEQEELYPHRSAVYYQESPEGIVGGSCRDIGRCPYSKGKAGQKECPPAVT